MEIYERPSEINGLKLNLARSASSGPPLVMLHGVTRRWTDFMSMIPTLAFRWQVTSLDLRGHGYSARADSYRVRDYVDDIEELTKKIGEPLVLYGHSLGAMTAAGVAARLPHLMRGLVLEDPPFSTMGSAIRDTPFWGLFDGMRKALAEATDVATLADCLGQIPMGPPDGPQAPLAEIRTEAALRYSASSLLRMDPSVLEPIVAGSWLEGYDFDRIVESIDCPTLLLHADVRAGGMLQERDAVAFASGVRQCSHVRFPRVGHLLHGDAPTETLRVTCDFLESLR